jgi:hypothetical protein
LTGLPEGYRNSSSNMYVYYWETSCIFVPLSLGFKYSFGNGKIRPIVEGGVVLASSFDRNIKFRYSYHTSDWKSPMQDPKIDSYKMNFGGYAGVGLEYLLNDKNFIFVNAEGNLLDKIKLLQLKLGYAF